MSALDGIDPAFTGLLAGLVEVRSPLPYHACFGCGPEHESGLRVRCFETETGVVSPIVVPVRFAGPPGAAHGGIVAAYLDEVLAGAALRASGHAYVTGELNVRYVRPTPVERPIVGRARMTRDWGRFMDLEGALESLDGGETVATATGRFFRVDPARLAGVSG